MLGLLALGAWQGTAPLELAGPPNTGDSASDARLTYLANEGVLLAAGEWKVVVDAFVTQPYSIYAALPPELFARFMDGEDPFEGVDLALVSHAHPDHVQVAPAREVMRAHGDLRVTSAPQVAELVLNGLDADDPLRERLGVFLPEPGAWHEVLTLGEGAVRVTAFRIPHAGNRPSMQNLAHLVELGGVRFLHLGDGDARAEHLEPFALKERKVDVALVPYWWLLDAAGRELLAKYVAPRTIVALHVPPSEVDAVRDRLGRELPDAVVFGAPGESRGVAAQRETDASR